LGRRWKGGTDLLGIFQEFLFSFTYFLIRTIGIGDFVTNKLLRNLLNSVLSLL